MQIGALPHPCFSVFALLFISFILFSSPRVASDPQAKFLDQGCSLYNTSNPDLFFNNLNTSLANIRSQLNSSTRFVTTVSAHNSNPVYALFQCRDYLSAPDCLACFSVAASRNRNCSAANGARVIYDGCFLRYESNKFYSQTTQQGKKGFFGNQTVKAAGFNQTADSCCWILSWRRQGSRGILGPLEGKERAVLWCMGSHSVCMK